MAKGDFTTFSIDQEYTNLNPSSSTAFSVNGPPIGQGYLLMITRDVSLQNHQISINGNQLPSVDLHPHAGWATQMDRIPSGFLVNGNNTIAVERIGNDDFFVGFVAVHWREA